MFKMLKKQIWANFHRIIELFTQKIVTKLSKYGFGIRDPVKTYPGSRSQKGTGSRIRNTGKMKVLYISLVRTVNQCGGQARGGVKQINVYQNRQEKDMKK